MPVDAGWLLLTKIYAGTATAAVFVITAGLVFLGLRVRHLVKVVKRAPRDSREQTTRAWAALGHQGTGFADRGRRVWGRSSGSLRKVAETLRRAGRIGGA